MSSFAMQFNAETPWPRTPPLSLGRIVPRATIVEGNYIGTVKKPEYSAGNLHEDYSQIL